MKDDKEAADVILRLIIADRFSGPYYKTLKTAYSALHMRIAEKPTDRGTLGQKERYKYGRCPCCGKSVNNEMRYCGWCGKALDWSEVNAEN